MNRGYLLALLAVVLAAVGYATTGVLCNSDDLTWSEMLDQGINRFGDMQKMVVFDDTTRVLARPQPITQAAGGVVFNRVRTIVQMGTNAELVTHHARKDFVAYKIRLVDGNCGYVFSGGQFRVIAK